MSCESDCSTSDDEIDLEKGRQNRIISEVGSYERKRKRRLFITQVFISIIIIAFSMTMLALNFNCDTETAFVPLITLVIGFWFPQPKP